VSRDRLVAVFVVLASVTVCAVVWLLWIRPTREVVHERTRTAPGVVVVRPSRTPLRDSIREPKRPAKKGSGAGVSPRQATATSPQTGGAGSGTRTPAQHPTQKRRVPSRKRKTTASPQNPAQGGTAPYTAPARPSPPVTVTLPAPVAVCTPVAGVNC
jgi:hypothetical protein